MPTFAQTLVDTASAVAGFGAEVLEYDALSDDRLLEFGAVIAAHERAFGLVKAQHAAQIARRSRRELGHAGLAARNGFASPQKLLQLVGNVTAREAGQLSAVGSALQCHGCRVKRTGCPPRLLRVRPQADRSDSF